MQVYRLASDGTSSAELRSFGEQVQAFLGLRSTYAELESLKKIGPFVVACAETSTSQVSALDSQRGAQSLSTSAGHAHPQRW
jgi:hypothetical protein